LIPCIPLIYGYHSGVSWRNRSTISAALHYCGVINFTEIQPFILNLCVKFEWLGIYAFFCFWIFIKIGRKPSEQYRVSGIPSKMFIKIFEFFYKGENRASFFSKKSFWTVFLMMNDYIALKEVMLRNYHNYVLKTIIEIVFSTGRIQALN